MNDTGFEAVFGLKTVQKNEKNPNQMVRIVFVYGFMVLSRSSRTRSHVYTGQVRVVVIIKRTFLGRTTHNHRYVSAHRRRESVGYDCSTQPSFPIGKCTQGRASKSSSSSVCDLPTPSEAPSGLVDVLDSDTRANSANTVPLPDFRAERVRH